MATARKRGKRPASDGGEHEETQQGTAPGKRTKSKGSGGRAKKKQRGTTAPTDMTTAPTDVITAPMDLTTSEGSSRLLDLPAELRNRIYEYVAVNSGAELAPRTRGKLVTKTALGQVSKQVRNEFLAVLYVSVPTIKAHVFDFDFAHIVTFLNKLSDRELSALPTLSIPTHRKLCVHIEVRRGWGSRSGFFGVSTP